MNKRDTPPQLYCVSPYREERSSDGDGSKSSQMPISLVYLYPFKPDYNAAISRGGLKATDVPG